LSIEVRSGIHTGEVELVSERYRCLAVLVGARVGAIAGPGDVLVTAIVAELLARSRIRLTDRGVRALKGVPLPHRLFAAEADEPVRRGAVSGHRRPGAVRQRSIGRRPLSPLNGSRGTGPSG